MGTEKGACILCKWKTEDTPRRMFHKFPQTIKRRNIWLNAIGRNENSIGEDSVICSQHFKKCWYFKDYTGKMVLRRSSLPTLHIDGDAADTVKKKVAKQQASKSPIAVNRNTKTSNILKKPALKPSKTVAKAILRGSKTSKLDNKPRNRVTKKFKCNKCKRIFGNAGAYTWHIQVHNKEAAKKVTIQKTNKVVANRKPITKVKLPISPTKKAKKMPETDSKAKKVKLKPYSFECPVCEKKFSIYFTAFQHIQNNHPVDKNGDKVSPTSKDIIKPIHVEFCACGAKIRGDEYHSCPHRSPDNKYLCTGCNQVFTSLKLFEVHLDGVHGDNCVSLFFTVEADFQTWKTKMEDETATKYVMLKKYTDSQAYHCSHETDGKSDCIHLCPGTITVKELLPGGLLVTYYKAHVGHQVSDLNPENYKKNIVTPFLRDTDDIDVSSEDDKDLYLQFKKVMNSIVLDAAKINVGMLKTLLSKAFEMTTVLNVYDEEDDSVQSKKMTDEQITRVLEDKSLKRKGGPVDRDLKKSKLDDGNTDTAIDHRDTKKFKVNNDGDSKKVGNTDSGEIKKVKNIDNGSLKKEAPITPVRLMQSPTSFNDSYKSFVNQNFRSQDKPKKKEVVKTKIGQFKPNSPKKESSKMYRSPKNDSSPKNAGSPKINSSTKHNVKPKNYRLPKITKMWSKKHDIQYEVKERENDCNILILKI